MHINRFVLFYIFCLVLNTNLKAQNFGTVISEKYDTEIYDFGRLSDGKWIFAVKLSPLPNALDGITLAVILTDARGNHLKTIPIKIIFPGEKFEIIELVILPNDDFMISNRGGDCDADLGESAIQKMDTIGAVFWAIRTGTYSEFFAKSITADGNIVGFENNKIKKISSLTGETIWEYKLDSIHYKSKIIVPGTDDIIFGDELGLKYYKKDSFPGGIVYKLIRSQAIEMNSGYVTRLQTSGDGIFYALTTIPKAFIRFRTDLVSKAIIANPDFSGSIPKKEGIVLIKNQTANSYKYSIYDTLGVKVDSFKIELSGIHPHISGCFDGGLGVTGSYQSGSNHPMYPDDLFYGGRHQGWFNFYPDYHNIESTQIFSLSIKDLVKTDPVKIDFFFEYGPDYQGNIYSFTEGKYDVKIVNTGNQPVDSFWVNTVFNDLTNYWFCPPAAATQRKYIVPKLLPGDSIWVEFGDFNAMRQSVLPVEFCFWTSGPNQHPDFISEDDMYCINSGLQPAKKTWTEATYFNNNNGWFTKKFKFDSIPVILDGNNYSNLLRAFTEHSTSWLASNVFLREQDGNIYMHVTGGEKILYDFNLMKGDTFHTGDPNLVQDFYVNLVDTVQLLNGDFRKRFFLEAINPIDENSDANHVVWIEDIGNINGLMTNSNPWTVGWKPSTLLCMNWDATLVYNDPNQDVCWLMTTSTNEISKKEFYFIPNPATEEITLMGYDGEIDNIKVYDTNSRLFFRGNSKHIKLNEFPSGYYYAVIQLKNTQLRTIGFVKI